MFRSIACIFCFFGLVLIATFALAQTEFSAEIVNTHKESTKTQAKIYFARDKVRIEPQEKRDSKNGGAFIMNLATQTATVLMPEQHMYMEMPASTMGERGMYSFFRTGDVENACSDWQKMPRNQGGTCRKVGNETVNGRNTVKYEGTNESGDAHQVWLDPKLRLPVKWQGKDSSGELRNIQEEAQPASLFEVPAGFTKMDIGGMMQQRQH
jgi:hypothetical protein